MNLPPLPLDDFVPVQRSVVKIKVYPPNSAIETCKIAFTFDELYNEEYTHVLNMPVPAETLHYYCEHFKITPIHEGLYRYAAYLSSVQGHERKLENF